MKKLFFLCVWLLIIISICYVLINCVVKIEDNSIGIFKDRRTGERRILITGYNFIWQGIIPGRISLNNINKKNIDFFDLKIKIKPLEGLNNDSYSIKIQVNVLYEIDVPVVADVYLSQLGEGSKVFYSAIMNFINGYFKEESSSYFYPNYRRSDFLRDKDKIIKRTLDKVKGQCKRIGINILNYDIIGGIYLPPRDIYKEGVRYCRELREKEKNNKKELIKLNAKLQRDKNLNNMYFEKLGRISNLIKETPDILKYIYIDKMSDNVRVIIAPEKSGIPFLLNQEENKDFLDNSRKGDIDNLR